MSKVQFLPPKACKFPCEHDDCAEQRRDWQCEMCLTMYPNSETPVDTDKIAICESCTGSGQ